MTDTAHPPGFWKRNRDELILESIGGLFLALLVSVIISWMDQNREETRAARDEALSNSIFVRQAVMNESTVLPFSGLYLDSAQLSGLLLAGADFSGVDFTGAKLTAGALQGARYVEDEPPTGVDASEASSLTPAEADLDDD